MTDNEDEPAGDDPGSNGTGEAETDESVYGGGHAGGHETERTTAPQSPYSFRDVAVGFAILLAGLVVTFAIPLVVTL